MLGPAQFYVLNVSGTALVPATYLLGANGQPLVNPNTSPDTVHRYSSVFFNSDGSIINNANPNNYLVVPLNSSLQSVASFAAEVRALGLVEGPMAAAGMMVGAYIRRGPQDFQRTYEDIDGNLVRGGETVPAFRDATSFLLGVGAVASGFDSETATRIGGIYNSITPNTNTSGTWGADPRNEQSTLGGGIFFQQNRDAINALRPRTELLPDGSIRLTSLDGSETIFSSSSGGADAYFDRYDPMGRRIQHEHVASRGGGDVVDDFSHYSNGVLASRETTTVSASGTLIDSSKADTNGDGRWDRDCVYNPDGSNELSLLGYTPSGTQYVAEEIDTAPNGTIVDTTYTANPTTGVTTPGTTTVSTPNRPGSATSTTTITGAAIGSIFGSSIGQALGGTNAFTRVAAGSMLSTALGTVGGAFDLYFNDTRINISPR
jgi:hypothetical protein